MGPAAAACGCFWAVFAVAPLVKCAYGENFTEKWHEKMIEKRNYLLSFPVGIKAFGRGLNCSGSSEIGSMRGNISGFSPGAARRLREFVMIFDVSGSVKCNMTLTIPEVMSPAFYYESLMRFRQRLNYHKIPGVYRVELQRRKVPHLHAIFYLSSPGEAEKIKIAWLESIKTSHKWADKRAVKWRFDDSKENINWILYACLHSGKNKRVQLGWKGKQWGVWNRSMFQAIAPEVYYLSRENYCRLVRIINGWQKSKRKGKRRKNYAKVSFMGNFSRIGLSSEIVKRIVDFITTPPSQGIGSLPFCPGSRRRR